MNRLETLNDLANTLGNGGPFQADKAYQTVGCLVDDLINMGNTDKVYTYHDEHLGLKDELSNDFLSADINEINEDFEEEVIIVLEQAERIVELFQAELTDSHLEDIKEDKYYRGVKDD